jgi:hypothetical protein
MICRLLVARGCFFPPDAAACVNKVDGTSIAGGTALRGPGVCGDQGWNE